MLSVEDYLARVVSLATVVPAEDVPVSDGVGRVLAEDLLARFAVPPFDNSAMDGFAVRAAELSAGARLRVIGDVPAGASSAPAVGAGECARIMTGAPLPPGADAVVPVELTDQPMGDAPLPEWIVVHETVDAGRHVRHRGEDVPVGQLVLPAGTVWSPEVTAAAASIGYGTVPLRRRPRVAVLATGDELVAPGEELGFGQIPDSNSYLLAALVSRFGGEVVLRRAVGDDPAQFRAVIDEALAADVVVTTGGVSVGAYEVVRQVVEGDIEFVRVNMQPGKPQASGLLRAADGRGVPFLGLPGNPVSTWVSAWLFLRPLLAELTGAGKQPLTLQLPVRETWRKSSHRRQFIPVRLVDGGVAPSHGLGSGSHLIASLHRADGMAMVPEDRESPGDTVEVLITR
ncbi:gephyrin-like molybdotransferase Glp [Tessaracoccus sp. MC1756]|uniref:molybdopterin molybdotransferase MoeA n=1 Tax=Tessaracoccus sp. MC1756 TaxID=2760311 RepID=UPI0016006CDB|nr:gephyrin-like molybdotransferase Glp [Tessaracoccus sp. MC1756]MBB1508610.1 molybdopterin molybdotransferase MoeA [Tessaracoccus sp. MC1756]